ncbi:DUF4385 domain-containing protein [Salibacterium halotolerans]|uniref:Cytoplasmic protein n=1 Tax=Salibacterium halotolerans TaxID=1884432 RepID=A0A1I5XP40_9BACI|nr:DUF4385 domain-containing protein [Salibacterium halotolerans]SFQ33704.1 protein of unknown function [Salibacterium halotolerans]
MSIEHTDKQGDIDHRQEPHRYRVGRGEKGVMNVEPYKSELLPYWRFKTSGAARTSSENIYQLFLDYKEQDDFVGMDMARKFLQMGYTRAKRYAKYPGGKKYNKDGTIRRTDFDPEKEEAAAVCEKKWKIVREDPEYLSRKKAHQKAYG